MEEATLAERVDTLERELEALRQEVSGKRKKKDWRAWRGTSKNDPLFDEMIRLGREYRQSLREDYDKDDAGS